MKKFVSGLAAAALLAGGGIALESATVASNAAVVVKADSYGPSKPEINKTIDKLNKLVKQDKLTPAKAAKIIKKLKAAKAAGVIGKAKYKKLKKKINRAL